MQKSQNHYFLVFYDRNGTILEPFAFSQFSHLKFDLNFDLGQILREHELSMVTAGSGLRSSKMLGSLHQYYQRYLAYTENKIENWTDFVDAYEKRRVGISPSNSAESDNVWVCNENLCLLENSIDFLDAANLIQEKARTAGISKKFKSKIGELKAFESLYNLALGSSGEPTPREIEILQSLNLQLKDLDEINYLSAI